MKIGDNQFPNEPSALTLAHTRTFQSSASHQHLEKTADSGLLETEGVQSRIEGLLLSIDQQTVKI